MPGIHQCEGVEDTAVGAIVPAKAEQGRGTGAYHLGPCGRGEGKVHLAQIAGPDQRHPLRRPELGVAGQQRLMARSGSEEHLVVKVHLVIG